MAALALQERFFAPPNYFSVEQVTNDSESIATFKETLRRHAQGHTDRAVLLPYKPNDSSQVVWYACVHTDAMARALQGELNALLGPSFVRLWPAKRTDDLADQHALPSIAEAGWRAVRLEAVTAKADDIVLRQWRLYWGLLDRRPRAASYVPQTFDGLRAAFDRALAARNEAVAMAALVSLRERFGVSAENRLFLEIRLAAALERWDQIAAHPLLPKLVQLNLPPETYGDVIEALYEVFVRPFEAAPHVHDLLTRFLETVGDIARPLFRTRRTSRRPSVLKTFMLDELTQQQPQTAACQALLQHLPIGAFGALDSAVRDRASVSSAADGVTLAERALEAEQFDRAYELLWPLADDLKVLRGLVVCARESDDSLKASAVLARIDAAESSLRLGVEAASPGRLAKLRGMVPTKVRAALTLSEQLVRSAHESADQYVARWRELVRSVEPEAVLGEDGLPALAADCLTLQALEQADIFERLYPLWHELFVERIKADRRLVPVYSALLETLRVRDAFGEAELALLHQTLVAMVQADSDESDYRNAVDEVHAVFMTIRSPQAISWGLDVCDSLATMRTRDPDARMRFLVSVIQSCSQFSGRLTPLQRQLVKLLAEESQLQLPDDVLSTPQPDDTSPIEEPLRDRTVVFYSLDETSTRRAVKLLKELHPYLRLETNADQVCTPRLKSLAQTANVFVFAWRCSKHAAYDCVKAALKAKENLIMAPGVGTTSLVIAALQRLQLRTGRSKI